MLPLAPASTSSALTSSIIPNYSKSGKGGDQDFLELVIELQSDCKSLKQWFSKCGP